MTKNDFLGVVIEESLEKKDILKKLKATKTKIEQVTPRHKTPWLKQWTLHTVEIKEKNADSVAKEMSQSLDSKHGASWYADFKNSETHYIIFRGRVFKIDRTSKRQYGEARKYGISLGIPEYQVNFEANVVASKE